MTREKYETLPLSELKGIAKVRGLKGCSTLRKAEIIDRMLAEDARIEAEKAAEEAKKAASEAKKAASKKSDAGKKEAKADKKTQAKATAKKSSDAVRTPKNTRLKNKREEDGSAEAEESKKTVLNEEGVSVSAEEENVSQTSAAPKAETA